jgi:hypothetical protein
MAKKKNKCPHPDAERKRVLNISDTVGSKNFVSKVFKCTKCGFYKRLSYTTVSGVKGGQNESEWYYTDKDPKY